MGYSAGFLHDIIIPLNRKEAKVGKYGIDSAGIEWEELAVTRNTIASAEGETFCKVGFPIRSVDKFIPNRTDFTPIDDSHLTITIALPQPTDGSEVTYERLSEAFEKWKESQPIKKPKDKDETAPTSAPP